MLLRWLRRLGRDQDRVLAFTMTRGSALLVREGARYRDLVEIARHEMVHTRVRVDEPLCSGFAYTDAMHAALWLSGRSHRGVDALCLGGGGGVVARQLEAVGARVDVVDSSAAVLDLASKHFDLHESASLVIHHSDAAEFVARASPARYDVVLVDLFAAFEASPLLAQRGFFESVRRCLRPEGAVAVNMVGALDGSAGAMLATQHALEAAFEHSLAIPMLADHERATGTLALRAPRNVVAFATHGPLPRSLPNTPAPANLAQLSDALADLSARLRALDSACADAAAGRAMPLRSVV